MHATQRWRRAFKRFNAVMLLLWRLRLGRVVNAWPSVAGRILVLSHTGRRSGLTRRTPLNYAVVDGDVYCVSGFGPGADWYRNVVADPRVEVWLPNARWPGTAQDVTDEAGRTARVRAVLVGSGFAARLAGIDPRRVEDAELDRRTADYRLVRLRRAS